MVRSLFRISLLSIFLSGAIVFSGCGTVHEGTSDDEWISAPPVSMTARLEYRVDSLTNENRRLSQQIESIQTENKNLNMRLTDLQTKSPEPPVSKPIVQATPAPTTRSTLPAAYETALGKFRSRNYQGAIDEFNELLKGGVSEDLVDNCHFWIGESNFAMKKYKDAITSYQRVTAMTNAEKGDDAQLMIGNAYVAMGDKAQAKQAFQKLYAVPDKSVGKTCAGENE